MEAQHAAGHVRGHVPKTKKRPWPRFIVFCMSIMLILIVSRYFNYRVPFITGVLYHFCQSPSSRLSPTPSICLPVAPPSLGLQPEINHLCFSIRTPYCKFGLAWADWAQQHDACPWPDQNLASEDATGDWGDFTIASYTIWLLFL